MTPRTFPNGSTADAVTKPCPHSTGTSWRSTRSPAGSLAEAPPPASSDAPSPPGVDFLKYALTKPCHSVTAPAVPGTQYQRLPVPQHHVCAVPYLRTGRLLAR